MKMDKTTNVIISGIGGQGVITLALVIAESAFKQGYDVKTAEVHGLAMRFGHIDVHVRFGKKVYSSLVPDGEADLVISLEPLEALRMSRYMNKNTKVVFDSAKLIPNEMHLRKQQYPEIKSILKLIKKVSKHVRAVDASGVVKKYTGSLIQSNIYLLGHVTAQKMIPLKKNFVLDGMKEVVSEKFFDTNKEIFELGFKLKK
jgi:indolepyruvate ferredoxin oxidoreductase beta subunit